jgi:hypothetical protein
VADDPLCLQINRPIPNGTANCRTLASFGDPVSDYMSCASASS